MPWYGTLLNERLIFGIYPSHAQRYQLERMGIDIIVDLTEHSEYEYPLKIHFPMEDGNVPTSATAFQTLIDLLLTQLKEGKKIYVHCQHGHGRTGLTVACLIGKYLQLDSSTTMTIVTDAYRLGHGAKSKYKLVPVHRSQQKYVEEYLQS